jgi:hypothetical protein
MGINEIEGILKFSPVLGKSQGLAGQTVKFLAKGEVISFDIGGINLTGVPIGSFQRSGLSFDGSGFPEDDTPSYLDHASSLAFFFNLSIP